MSAYERDEIRTLEQNKKFHALIADIAAQVQWAGELIEAEDWKRLFIAGKFDQKVVPDPLGYRGFVVMNKRRSRGLTVEEMSEFIAEIEAFGAERGVNWTDDED